MDNFCEKMVKIGLKRFLISNLRDYLSYALVVKYKLKFQGNGNNEQDDDEDYQM